MLLTQLHSAVHAIEPMGGRREDSFRRSPPKLPVIAPRNESGMSNPESTGVMALSNNAVDVPRTRLPPRSRSGCWTCRQRKVKCDEERPTCRQCSRLHHICDYGSRLSFRDDTTRVKERMQEVQTAGSFVWDPQAPSPEYNSERSKDDLLPPFSDLTNDEEREAKARSKHPGTYLVVANPSSFAHLPEYSENSPSSSFQSSSFLGAIENPFEVNGPRSTENTPPVEHHDDPNIVILRTFEDPLRRPSIQPASSKSPSPKPSVLSQSANSPQTQTVLPYRVNHSHAPATQLDERIGRGEARLLQHYRAHISPHIINVASEDVGQDIFEVEARVFPPLFHAIMAISALSLAKRNILPTTDAILHYGRVLTALQAEASMQRSSSDGAFFTHYLLFLYEISDAGPRDDHLWQNHSNRLLQIFTQRRDSHHTEAYKFIMWALFLVNAYAILSGIDDGSGAKFLMRNNMVPLPQDSLYALDMASPSHLTQGELRCLPSMRKLKQQLVLLAVHIGQTAREIRADSGRSPNHHYLQSRQARASETQARCRAFSIHWSQNLPSYWPQLPDAALMDPKQLGLLYHAHMLYRACVIFAHTSLYPGQLMESQYTSEVSTSISEILTIAHQIVMTGSDEFQHLGFALCMAGFASLDGNQKRMAVDLLRAIEMKGHGGNSRIVRETLEGIYERQRATADRNGYNSSVDFWDEIRKTGRGLVIVGL